MNVRTDKQMLLLNKSELLEYIRELERELHEPQQAVIELSVQEDTTIKKDIYKF